MALSEWFLSVYRGIMECPSRDNVGMYFTQLSSTRYTNKVQSWAYLSLFIQTATLFFWLLSFLTAGWICYQTCCWSEAVVSNRDALLVTQQAMHAYLFEFYFLHTKHSPYTTKRYPNRFGNWGNIEAIFDWLYLIYLAFQSYVDSKVYMIIIRHI
jgi:hypothetical protein